MPVPVLSVQQMRQWEDASWTAGRSQSDVIQRAGYEVAKTALKLTHADDRILILAGKGHNGDDAREAHSHLVGRRVKLFNVTDPVVNLPELKSLIAKRPSLVIDGLFGIGLSRPLDPPWVEFIEAINEQNLPILAVDVPSGLSSETGEPQPIALIAMQTITFGAPKSGLLASSSAAFVGKLELAGDIGLIDCPHSSELQWTLAEDFAGFPPPRRIDGHKGTFGHVAIVAGSEGYHGAAVLSSRGALRARPGLVSIYSDPAAYPAIAAQSRAAMVHPFDPSQPEAQLAENCSAIVLGPGLASPRLNEDWKRFANEQWQNFSMPVVIDASALNWIEPGPTALNSRRVLTPHPGEAARLLGTKPATIQENRLAALRAISSKFGNCWVVLKGHQTLVGRSTGEVFVNSSGDAFLAQGGSGDVLAGFLGGLLAQTKLQANPLKTIRYAIWAHGRAAELLSHKEKVWTVDDLIATIGDHSVSPD